VRKDEQFTPELKWHYVALDDLILSEGVSGKKQHRTRKSETHTYEGFGLLVKKRRDATAWYFPLSRQ
jgi:hypothetical protein